MLPFNGMIDEVFPAFIQLCHLLSIPCCRPCWLIR